VTRSPASILQPSRADRRFSLLLFAVFLCASVVLSLHPRIRQYQTWQENPSAYWAGEIPVSSVDSYYWFRLAREIRDGADFEGRDPLRAYPEGRERGGLPAISWLIAALSPFFDGDVYRAGIWLSIALSSLFIVPLGLYGLAIGYPAAGVLGGLVGALSHVYMQRSSITYVDTDGGNLFFVWLLAWTIVSVRADSSFRRSLVFAALAGLGLAAFCRWYAQPGFWLIYLVTFALHVSFAGFSGRRALQLALVFVFCSNPSNAVGAVSGIADFLGDYVLAGASPVTPLDYRSVTREITELKPLPLVSTLARVVDAPRVVAVGMAGFALLAAFHWRRVIALLPILALAGLALVSARRFGMYLAPLPGIGWGVLLAAGIGAVVRIAPVRAARLGELTTYGIAALGFLLLLDRTGFGSAPRTPIPRELIASLRALKERLPPESAILTSWGLGYLVADVTGAATFDDGKAPDPVIQYLYYRAITGDDPDELARIVGFLASNERSAVHELFDAARSPEQALERIAAAELRTSDAVHVLFTNLATRRFSVYFRWGQWNFETGFGPFEGYDVRSCRRTGETTLNCVKPGTKTVAVDLERGTIEGWPGLSKCVVIRDGSVEREIDYPYQITRVLQLIEPEWGGYREAHFLRDVVFRSNFNQMYLLGRFDPATFQEVHNDFPVARAFRLLAPLRGPSSGPK
jgi:dolichyl-diphosphooligosaccharide--protein glycosyltransferase